MKNNYILIIGIAIAVILVSFAFMNFSMNDLMAQNETAGRIAYVDIVEIYNVHPQKETAEQKLGKLAHNIESTLKEKSG